MKSLIRPLLLHLLKRHPALCRDALEMSGSKPFFIEYDFAPTPRYGYGKPPHQGLYNLINKNRDDYKKTLLSFLEFQEYFEKIPADDLESSLNPFWRNAWLAPLDAIALYSFLCLYKPKRFLEIGSGNSTKFAKRAIIDHNLETKITCVDPFPRAKIDEICDSIIKKRLEGVDLRIFDELHEGDILFIDATHQCLMNSDVAVVFLEVLPRLRSKVLIQLHDIFLPYDYLPGWEARYYTEQYLLAAYLLANPNIFNIILPNYFILNDPELIQILRPIWHPEMNPSENQGSSVWLTIH